MIPTAIPTFVPRLIPESTLSFEGAEVGFGVDIGVLVAGTLVSWEGVMVLVGDDVELDEVVACVAEDAKGDDVDDGAEEAALAGWWGFSIRIHFSTVSEK